MVVDVVRGGHIVLLERGWRVALLLEAQKTKAEEAEDLPPSKHVGMPILKKI
jgi:hypothetical protein